MIICIIFNYLNKNTLYHSYKVLYIIIDEEKYFFINYMQKTNKVINTESLKPTNKPSLNKSTVV